jgi:hypothetical protein
MLFLAQIFQSPYSLLDVPLPQSLVDAKLLQATTGDVATSETSYLLNLGFTSKKLKIKISAPVQAETQQERSQTHTAVDEDRKFYLQVR